MLSNIMALFINDLTHELEMATIHQSNHIWPDQFFFKVLQSTSCVCTVYYTQKVFILFIYTRGAPISKLTNILITDISAIKVPIPILILI